MEKIEREKIINEFKIELKNKLFYSKDYEVLLDRDEGIKIEIKFCNNFSGVVIESILSLKDKYYFNFYIQKRLTMRIFNISLKWNN